MEFQSCNSRGSKYRSKIKIVLSLLTIYDFGWSHVNMYVLKCLAAEYIGISRVPHFMENV